MACSGRHLILDTEAPCRCPNRCYRRTALADAGRRDLRELVAPLGLDAVLRAVAELPPLHGEGGHGSTASAADALGGVSRYAVAAIRGPPHQHGRSKSAAVTPPGCSSRWPRAQRSCVQSDGSACRSDRSAGVLARV